MTCYTCRKEECVEGDADGMISWNHKKISFWEYMKRKIKGDKDVYWGIY